MVDVFPAGPDALEPALAILDRGGLLVVPTDTVYGLAVRIDRPDAIRRLFDVKVRERDASIPVLVGGLKGAEKLGDLSPMAVRLAEQFWPGALTLVVRRSPDLVADLGSDKETVGLRQPDHEFCLSLLDRAGPLAVTSANVSGRSTPSFVDEIRDALGENVDLYISEGHALGDRASTVVSVVGEPSLLREGKIGWEEIRQVL